MKPCPHTYTCCALSTSPFATQAIEMGGHDSFPVILFRIVDWIRHHTHPCTYNSCGFPAQYILFGQNPIEVSGEILQPKEVK